MWNTGGGRDRDRGRNYIPGNIKRELKRKKEESIKSQTGALETFLIPVQQLTPVDTPIVQNESENREQTENNQDADEAGSNGDEEELSEVDSRTEDQLSTSTFTEHNSTKLNIFEISNWPDLINDKLRVEIVKRKLNSEKMKTSPADKVKKYFNRLSPNGEIVQRKWLVHSEITNQLFCFVCKLFHNRTHGFNNWNHEGDRLKEHETSQRHYECIMKLNLLENDMKHENLIDQTSMKIIDNEIEKLKNVLKRIVKIWRFVEITLIFYFR